MKVRKQQDAKEDSVYATRHQQWINTLNSVSVSAKPK
jgi:hypothetical protein